MGQVTLLKAGAPGYHACDLALMNSRFERFPQLRNEDSVKFEKRHGFSLPDLEGFEWTQAFHGLTVRYLTNNRSSIHAITVDKKPDMDLLLQTIANGKDLSHFGGFTTAYFLIRPDKLDLVTGLYVNGTGDRTFIESGFGRECARSIVGMLKNLSKPTSLLHAEGFFVMNQMPHHFPQMQEMDTTITMIKAGSTQANMYERQMGPYHVVAMAGIDDSYAAVTVRLPR
jgi:hypothetical protein